MFGEGWLDEKDEPTSQSLSPQHSDHYSPLTLTDHCIGSIRLEEMGLTEEDLGIDPETGLVGTYPFWSI